MMVRFLQPGDLGSIVQLHGAIYSVEYGFNREFETYVADPLTEFVERQHPRERLWIFEDHNRMVGCIAIVEVDQDIAQLRWLLVDPQYRRDGIGKSLMNLAVNFCRAQGYQQIILWTVGSLKAAARLYQRFGFEKTESKPDHLWGVDVIQEKYELQLHHED